MIGLWPARGDHSVGVCLGCDVCVMGVWLGPDPPQVQHNTAIRETREDMS